MPRSRILSFDDAFKKLSDASKVSSRRGYVKPHEQGRVDEALSLLVNGSTGISLGTKARSFYLDFLRDVENTCGIRMVILCAFGLGKATIASLAEGVRLRLPPEIRKRLDDLDNEVLQVLAKGYPAKCKECTSRWFTVLIVGQLSQIRKVHSQKLRKHNKMNQVFQQFPYTF